MSINGACWQEYDRLSGEGLLEEEGGAGGAVSVTERFRPRRKYRRHLQVAHASSLVGYHTHESQDIDCVCGTGRNSFVRGGACAFVPAGVW